jgi:hypothetical protein
MSPPDIVIEKATDKRRHGRIKEGKILSIEMTESCARDLTDRIKTAVDDVAEMLYRAHEGRAWAALGYESWKAYCETEFRNRSEDTARKANEPNTRDIHRALRPTSLPNL